MKIKPVKEGDMFFNADRSLYGTVVKVEEDLVSYTWKDLNGNFVRKVQAVKKTDFYKTFKVHWNYITPLEKELL